MLFNSFSFAIFLPIVFALYWVLPHKLRWIILFIASYWFYMSWNPKYVVLILLTTLVSFFAAIVIERQDSKKKRKTTLIISSVICLGVLFFFKYFNFFSESVAEILKLFTLKTDPYILKLLLPVGISFYTFQTMSYVIDVYKGKVPAERHFGIYATFISFFPQLVAGPIERTENLLPQIKSKKTFDYSSATYGLKIMAWGYFKKLIVADTISQYVAPVFEEPQAFGGFSFFIGVLLFTFQIYCDFSGYSDIAVGVAKLLGINLMTNFKSPYLSQSVREFWSRWHISLSTWFRDYVYIPLGGNRVSSLRNSLNLLVTFLVSGLWHGANWTFVVWGGIHGVAQITEKRLFKSHDSKTGSARWILKTFIVFCFCVITWLFFASQSLSDAIYIIKHVFDGISAGPMTYIATGFKNLGLDKVTLAFLSVSIILLMVYDYFSLKRDVITIISSQKTYIRWGVYVLFILWIIISLPSVAATEFIYFQF